MKPERFPFSIAAATTFVMALSMASSIHAATSTWTGTTNGTWDTTTAANWGGTAFASSNDALFTGTPTNNVTSATGLTIGAITLDNTFTGTVTMTGSNTVNGTITVNGGTLTETNTSATTGTVTAGGIGSASVAIGSSGTFYINETGNGTSGTTERDLAVANTFTGTGLLKITPSAQHTGGWNTVQLNGNLSGFTGTLDILAGASNRGKAYLGATTQGTVLSSSATLKVQSGATLYLNKALNYGFSTQLYGTGNSEGLGALRLEEGANVTGGVTLFANSDIGTNVGTGTISGAIGQSGGSFGFTKSGGSTLVLSGTNTYTGTTTVNAGKLNITGSISSGTTGNLVFGNATVNIASGGSVSVNNLTMANNGNILNIAGNLTGNAAQANAQNKIQGLVTQTAGTVTMRGLDLSDTAGNTATYYLGGTGVVNAGKGQYNSLSVGGRGVSSFYVSGSGALTVTGDVSPGASNANQLTVGSVFNSPTAGTSTFVQQGGTVSTNGLLLGGTSGTVTPGIYYLTGGTLTTSARTRGSNAVSSGTLVFGGGTFKNGAAISTDANVTTQINSGGATIDTTAGNLIWSGAIAAGTTGNVKGFTGLSGGSGYTSAPTVSITSGGGAGATAVAEIDQAGQVVDVVITNPGSGYTSAPTFTFSAPTSGTTATVTASTIATGNGGLTKSGANTLTLSGANTYTGATSITSGILNVTGSTASGSTFSVGGVAATGTPKLTGSGTINGGVNLNAAGGGVAGRLNAGDSTSSNPVGALAMGSTLNFETGSIFEWDINANKDGDGLADGDDGAAGTDFDKVTAVGNIDVGSSTIFKVIFGNSVGMANSFWSAPNTTQVWNMSTIFGKAFNSGSFASVQTSTDVSSYGSFTITGTTLTWSAVPEPTSAFAGLLIGAGLLRRRRQ